MRTSKNLFLLLGIFLNCLLAGCGASPPNGEVPSHALILVTSPEGEPVAGATVWVPADSGEGIGTDTSGNGCAEAPEPALFASCSGPDGITLLECPDGATFLFKIQKDNQSGITSAKCGDGSVTPAPIAP